jgi:hypothetical protein
MNQPFFTRSGWNVLLVVLFCLVHLGLLLTFGIYTQEEALKYVYEADHFLEHGSFSQPKYIFYSGYIFLHVVAQLTSGGSVLVYVVQLLLSALAAVSFYRLSLTVSGRRIAALAATLLLILCIPLHKWTAYLFTESIFFSLIILYAWVLFVKRNLLLGAFLLCLLIICRPTGMLVIPATFALASHTLWHNKKKLWAFAIWLPALAGLWFLLDAAMKGKGEFDFLLPLVQKHIICGVPASDAAGDARGDGGSLSAMLQYIADHPGDFLELAFRRLIAFFGLVRPYYSGLHNGMLMAFFYPVYLLAIAGIPLVFRKARPFFYFSMILIATFAASVMFTCDDWHNRFIMPVMFVVFIYAGIGLGRLFRKN